MNKKIKLIELLNRIASKKDLPNSINFYGEQYDLDRHDTYINYGYTDEKNCDRWLIDDKWEIAQCLNDEVEILEDNTEEIEEKSNFEDMGYEIAQAYFEFYKGIAKALTEKRKESEDKQ